MAEDVFAAVQLARQKRALERHEDLQGLTAGLAHHLNNIMTVIFGAAEEVETSLPEDDPLRETARLGLDAGHRAARLVDSLVVYSGSAALVTEPVAIDATLAVICERMRRHLPAGVELVTDLLASSTSAMLAAGLFEESVEQLLANARRAVEPRGRIEVATRLIEDAAGRPRISVTIRDDGAGMDEDTLRRIRDPFFTTREVGQGVGLGLSLADGFARHSHGSLEIDSDQGVGTRVELRLPVLDAAESGLARAI